MYSILVATPCYNNNVTTEYLRTIVKLTKNAEKGSLYYSLNIKTVSLPDIAKARNYLTGYFMQNKYYSHLLFIDSDMGFEYSLLEKMLNFNQPIVAALCPVKSISPDKAFVCEEYLYSKPTPNKHFIEISSIGTGIMLIQREVILYMTYIYKDMIVENDSTFVALGLNKPVLQCFSPIQDKTGSFLSEDLSFCKRWTDIEGKIWACIDEEITHVGQLNYKGRYSDKPK